LNVDLCHFLVLSDLHHFFFILSEFRLYLN